LVEPAGDCRDGEITGAFPFGWLPRDAEEVAGSWRRQFLRVDVEGESVRIQARLDKNAFAGVVGDQGDVAGGWPLVDDVLIAGSVRGPVTYFFEDQLRSRDELHHQATTFHVSVVGGVLVDRGHQWSEPAVIATGLAASEDLNPDWQERFVEICHGMGIGTVVRLRAGLWQVLTLRAGGGNRVRVLSSDPCSITRDVDHRCVMLPAPEVGQYCHMRGGPWTSRSMSAAAAWKSHRTQIGAPVGCDTCEGKRYMLQGEVFEKGGPIDVVTSPVPTRWLMPHEDPIVMDGDDDV
jgi:hypothetical protein